MSWLRQIASIAALPGVVTLVIPYLLASEPGTTKPGWGLSSPLNYLPIAIGLLIIGLGLTLMVQTISLFITVGRGTLAPWDATHKLVVRGIYRHVRNPMITGVFCVLVGEAALFGSIAIFIWSLLFALINMIYIPLSEEPGLERRFGEDYLQYKQNVPRWLPRPTPWQPSNSINNHQTTT
jgi:protein-S-isoprenylcysteine O-methyltransferase Ste14